MTNQVANPPSLPSSTQPRSLLSGVRNWFVPLSKNRDDAFRERTLRLTLFIAFFFAGLSFLSGLIVFQDAWGVISFPSLHVYFFILLGISAYFVTRQRLNFASQFLILAFYVGIIGFHLLARQQGSPERFFTGVPLFMFPALVAALLLNRNTIVPISIISTIIYVLVEEVIPLPLADSTPFDIEITGLVAAIAILLLMEGVILAQLRREFDSRFDALRQAVEQEEKARQQAETDRKRAEEADKAKSQFLANMSHELRTPLNAIIGYDEAMLGGMAGTFNQQQTKLLTNIQVNSRRLLALINDILDLSKVEAGALEVFSSPMSPRKVVTETIDSLSGLAYQKNIALEMYFDDSVPEIILSDSKKIQQILVNLISNAIKFTSQGGVYIDVRLLDKSNWQFTVRDTGLGIAQEAQQYIFEPFRQVDNTDTRAHKGTGLGLAIVKRLTESLNGTIALASAPGQGAAFTVTLPRVNIPLAEEPDTPVLLESVSPNSMKKPS